MRRPSSILLAFFLLALIATPPSFGDILHLKNGEQVEGVIVEDAGSGVLVEMPIGTISFNHSEIERIEKKQFSMPARGVSSTPKKSGRVIYKGRSYSKERFERLVEHKGLIEHEGRWITAHQKKGIELSDAEGSALRSKIAEYASPAVVSVKVDDSKMGSGVLINSSGLFITNYHVVKDAKKLRVKLFDNDSEYPARVVTVREFYDLALASIGGTDRPFLTLADADEISVGDEVIAMGNPFGLATTVTTGIISSIRELKDFPGVKDADLRRWQEQLKIIQTDAAINPGNSGGPLLNKKGEIVGINTFGISKSVAEGLNFAIHARELKRVFDSYFE